jgi:uncharacterized protein
VEHLHHGIDYVELAVTDTAAAKAFYGSAFGWTFNDYGPGYVGYCDGRMRDGTRAEAGGLILSDKPAAPLAILYSSALEQTRDAVTAAGGTIAKDIFTFPGGRRFEFRDPAGNLLAVWSDR